MIKADYRKHSACLFASAILATGAINLPYGNADESNLIAYAIGFILFAAVLNVVHFAFGPLFSPNKSRAAEIFKIVVYLAIIFICFYTAQKSFNLFTQFVTDRMLPYSKKYAVAAVFAGTVIFLSLCEDGTLLKFSLISFVAFAIITAVLFCVSFKEFELENISLLGFPKIKPLISQSVAYFLSVLPLAVVFPAAVHLFKIKKGAGALNVGTLLGFAALCVVLLNCLLIFGPYTAGKMQYPYCDAVSTVTLSRLFTRMDGFAYFIYFAAELIKTALCITVIKKLLQKMGLKNSVCPIAALGVCMYLICIF